MKFVKLFFSVLLFSIVFMGISSKDTQAASSDDVSFDEFEVWYNQNFDDLRETSSEYKTDEEILKEISALNKNKSDLKGNISTLASTTNDFGGFAMGDILVTDVNSILGFNHGHAALVQNSLYTTEILRPGDKLTTGRSIETYWIKKYKSSMAHLRTQVYSSVKAKAARDWLYNLAKNNTIKYSLVYGVYDEEYTYCSKSAWAAWYNGAKTTLVSPAAGHVTPKMLYTSANLKIVKSTIGTWGS